MRKDEIPLYIVDLALKKGATDVAVKLHDEQHAMIRFSNNEVTVSKFYNESVMPLSSARNAEKAVNNLIKIAKITPPSELYAPLPEGPFNYDPKLLKDSGISLHSERLIGHVEEAINSALEESFIWALRIYQWR